MKILLVGEYSGVHTELANALKRHGHSVFTVSDGDSYKNFPRDVTINRKYPKGKLGIFIDTVFEFLGVKGIISYFKHRREINSFNGYDIVQIINPVALESFGSIANILFIKKLARNNHSLFLCALGDDRRWVNACLSGKYKYSALDEISLLKLSKFLYPLRYKYGLFFGLLQRTAEQLSTKIIPGLLDYKMAYDGVSKCTDVIPIPLPKNVIDIATHRLIKLEHQSLPERVDTVIFHGWQLGRELKKGNYIFDKAVKTLIDDKKHVIDYRVITSVPYQEYLSKLESSDIFLDQVSSYDRGVNALLGMAYGCVVFSGFEGDDMHFKCGVNALPDSEKIYLLLDELISNPCCMHEVKINSLKFVIKNHDPDVVAKKYLDAWSGVK